jgi:hypothetical protein
MAGRDMGADSAPYQEARGKGSFICFPGGQSSHKETVGRRERAEVLGGKDELGRNPISTGSLSRHKS